jgi:hypothetical protein
MIDGAKIGGDVVVPFPLGPSERRRSMMQIRYVRSGSPFY